MMEKMSPNLISDDLIEVFEADGVVVLQDIHALGERCVSHRGK